MVEKVKLFLRAECQLVNGGKRALEKHLETILLADSARVNKGLKPGEKQDYVDSPIILST